MLPKIRLDDYGFYSIRYYDGDGNVILPDLDGTLSWEFRDSDDVLQFTATLSSDPAITQESDGDGDYLRVIDIPLTDWALGIATVQAFAKKNAQEIEPYPMLASAFEVIQEVEGYCSAQDVINYTGIRTDDLERGSEAALQSLLTSWILDATDMIDEFCNQSWTPVEDAPRGVKNCCMRMVANLIMSSIQRRKSPIVQIGEFTVRMVEDIFLSDDIKERLTLYRKNPDRTNTIGMGVYIPPDEDEEIVS
jgi:hypothetical protein